MCYFYGLILDFSSGPIYWKPRVGASEKYLRVNIMEFLVSPIQTYIFMSIRVN